MGGSHLGVVAAGPVAQVQAQTSLVLDTAREPAVRGQDDTGPGEKHRWQAWAGPPSLDQQEGGPEPLAVSGGPQPNPESASTRALHVQGRATHTEQERPTLSASAGVGLTAGRAPTGKMEAESSESWEGKPLLGVSEERLNGQRTLERDP